MSAVDTYIFLLESRKSAFLFLEVCSENSHHSIPHNYLGDMPEKFLLHS